MIYVNITHTSTHTYVHIAYSGYNYKHLHTLLPTYLPIII